LTDNGFEANYTEHLEPDIIEGIMLDYPSRISFCNYKNSKLITGNILIDRVPMEPSDMKFVILHELGHVLQFNDGRLKTTHIGLSWKADDNKVYEFPYHLVQFSAKNFIWYNSLPWEYDTNLFVANSQFCPKHGETIMCDTFVGFVRVFETMKTSENKSKETLEVLDTLNPETLLANLFRLKNQMSAKGFVEMLIEKGYVKIGELKEVNG
jgi:hypothetical protein